MNTTEIVMWIIGILALVGLAVAAITTLVSDGVAGLSF